MAYAFTLAATKYLERTSGIIDYNANYTFAFWIIFNQLTTFDSMVGISDGSSNNRDLLLLDTTAGTTLATRVNVGGAQTTQAGSTTLSTGVWYYVALVRDAQNALKVYLNGNLEGTNTRSTSGRAASSQMRFGVDQGAGNPINASLAHMKAWSTAMTVAQLTNERMLIRPVWSASIYGWWPILLTNRGVDFSGQAHDWTENGTIGDVANPNITWGGFPITFSDPGEILGTASITEAGDTLSSAGVVDVIGAASITEAGDTISSTGTVAVVGDAAITEASDTLSSAGVVDVVGTASITEAGDSVASTGTVAIAGSASITESADSVSSAGVVAIVGSASITEANDSTLAAGVLSGGGGPAVYVEPRYIIVAEARNTIIEADPRVTTVELDERNTVIEADPRNTIIVADPRETMITG